MDDWAEIRRLHLSEQMPVKAIARRLGLARNTVRTALAADEPPTYERAPAGSKVDGFEPAIRALLAEFPDMPATVIAERIGWVYSSSVFRARIALLRPIFRPADPADRTTYVAGEIVQCDLWFPGKVVPVAPKVLADPPVLTMVAAYSGFIMATLLPSRTTGGPVAWTGRRRGGCGWAPQPQGWRARGLSTPRPAGARTGAKHGRSGRSSAGGPSSTRKGWHRGDRRRLVGPRSGDVRTRRPP